MCVCECATSVVIMRLGFASLLLACLVSHSLHCFASTRHDTTGHSLFFCVQAVAVAASEMEVARKKEFIDSRMRKFKLNMDIKAEKREGLRVKLGKSKQVRVENLEIQVMEEKAALPELNEFERTQADKRIKGGCQPAYLSACQPACLPARLPASQPACLPPSSCAECSRSFVG